LFHGQECKHRNTSGSPTSKANLDVASCLSSSWRKRLKCNTELKIRMHVPMRSNNWVYPWFEGEKARFCPILQIIKVKQFLHVNPDRKNYGRHRDNIKIDLREIVWEHVDWINSI
jgi:hypothetical protein